MFTGGCYCGSVRYEASEKTFHQTNCHCSICRRTTGAPYVTWFSVAKTDFRIVKGEPVRFRSTDNGRRSFCGQCGTQLTFEYMDLPDEIDITVCSLDDPNRIAPKEHIFTSTMLAWVKPGDGLKQHAETRSKSSGTA